MGNEPIANENESGWPYIPGYEMFLPSKIAAMQRAYAQKMGVSPEDVIITPYGYQPVVRLPMGDAEGRERLPPSLNADWARHPMFWLDPETRTRYPDESEWEWAIRIDLELTVRGLFDPHTGMVTDALDFFCGIDLQNPVDRMQVENYISGGYDQTLCAFTIWRDDDLSHLESRQMARDAATVLYGNYKRRQDMDRESAIGDNELHKSFVMHSPNIMESGFREFDELGVAYMRSSGAPAEVSIPARKAFSQHVDEMAGYIKKLHAHANCVGFVVLLHTEIWRYQAESERLMLTAGERERQRRAMVEDALGVLYQDPANPSSYAHIKNLLNGWFNEIYHYGREQVEQVNLIEQRRPLFRFDEASAEATGSTRAEIGRDRWKIGTVIDPDNQAGRRSN